MTADPEVMRYIGEGKPQDRAQAWRAIALFVGKWVLRGYGLWAVERASDGKLLGRVGLWRPEGWPGLEVGWALAREDWGNGYATEAGAAAMRYAWEALGAQELISVIEHGNLASQRVAGRLGLRVDRRERLGIYDVLIYQRSRPG